MTRKNYSDLYGRAGSARAKYACFKLGIPILVGALLCSLSLEASFLRCNQKNREILEKGHELSETPSWRALVKKEGSAKLVPNQKEIIAVNTALDTAASDSMAEAGSLPASSKDIEHLAKTIKKLTQDIEVFPLEKSFVKGAKKCLTKKICKLVDIKFFEAVLDKEHLSHIRPQDQSKLTNAIRKIRKTLLSRTCSQECASSQLTKLDDFMKYDWTQLSDVLLKKRMFKIINDCVTIPNDCLDEDKIFLDGLLHPLMVERKISVKRPTTYIERPIQSAPSKLEENLLSQDDLNQVQLSEYERIRQEERVRGLSMQARAMESLKALLRGRFNGSTDLAKKTLVFPLPEKARVETTAGGKRRRSWRNIKGWTKSAQYLNYNELKLVKDNVGRARQKQGVSPDKYPDLIINGKLIYDIYAPRLAIPASDITKHILKKTGEIKGHLELRKRQSDRIIVTFDSTSLPNSEVLKKIEQIKNLLHAEETTHVSEVLVLHGTNQEVTLERIYP